MPCKVAVTLNRTMIFVAIAMICMATTIGCKHIAHEVTPAIYFWKTNFDVKQAQQHELIELGIQKMYMRFFDVDLDALTKTPVPVADITFNSGVDSTFEIVPVVFIRNRVFENIDSSKIDTLATHISNRIDSICMRYHLHAFNEVQIDCDWTHTTASRYFKLLKYLSNNYHPRLISLSSTIRMHQVKYARLTGVPPVDRGMLMFYNMGDPEKASNANSIYDRQIAQSYLYNFENYNLPLDVALPLFKWAIVYRNKKPVDILDNTDTLNFDKVPGIIKTENMVYKVNNDMYFSSHQLNAGDLIKVENVDAPTCVKAAKQIAPYIKAGNISISIFNFRSNDFFTHDTNTIKEIYNSFR